MSTGHWNIFNDPYYWLFPVSILLAALFSLAVKNAKSMTMRNFLNRLSKLVDFWFGGDLLLLVVIVLFVIVLIIWG